MALTNFVCREAIIAGPEFQATSRDAAINELVTALQIAGQITPADIPDVVRAILRREQLGTTGIGKNIAIPHSRHPAVTQLIGALGVARGGIGFESVDGEPVHLLTLIVSPPDRPGEHLRALESVVTTFRDETLVKAIIAAETRDQIWDLLNRPGGSA
jgi:nitrogen PTS system EIIA component